jgi:hypothetical protein
MLHIDSPVQPEAQPPFRASLRLINLHEPSGRLLDIDPLHLSVMMTHMLPSHKILCLIGVDVE